MKRAVVPILTTTSLMLLALVLFCWIRGHFIGDGLLLTSTRTALPWRQQYLQLQSGRGGISIEIGDHGGTEMATLPGPTIGKPYPPVLHSTYDLGTKGGYPHA